MERMGATLVNTNCSQVIFEASIVTCACAPVARTAARVGAAAETVFPVIWFPRIVVDGSMHSGGVRSSGNDNTSAQPVGEERDGLAIDLTPVPLPHHLEIRGAFAVGLTGLPAVGLEQVRRRGKHVRHAVAQIDMAVAVEIDAVLDVGRGQEL